MIRTLKDLFDSFTAPARPSAEEQSHALRLATAVLLVEVMRADPAIDAREQQAVIVTLEKQFALTADEVALLMQAAERAARDANDYFRFTSTLNEHVPHPQKIQIVENMWRVAYADAHLGAHENQVVNKVAGLLHVTHGEYIAAKLRAKEAASLLNN